MQRHETSPIAKDSILRETKDNIPYIPIERLLNNYTHYARILKEIGQVTTDIWPSPIYHPKYFHPKMFELYYSHFPRRESHIASVLDLGTGHKPSPVTTVSGERYLLTTSHRPPESVIRHTGSLVQLDATHPLPFTKDQFDLCILSHVCEHLTPEELKQTLINATSVAKVCYIEVPSSRYETKYGYHEHLYWITQEKDSLVFRAKTREEWLRQTEQLSQIHHYRFNSNPNKASQIYREDTQTNYHAYYLGLFINAATVDKIRCEIPTEALTTREELDKLRKETGLDSSHT